MPSTPLSLAISALGLALGGVVAVLMAEVALHALPVTSGRTLIGPSPDMAVRRWRPDRPYRHSEGWNMMDATSARTNNAGFTNPQTYAEPHDGRPLIAVIGDSFVEAEMLPYDKTFFGVLGRELGARAHVYSFGVARAGLSEYLALARAARESFHPSAMVFNIVQGDVAESDTAQSKLYPGMHYFARDPTSDEVEWVEQPFKEQHASTVLKRSALLRYIYMNLKLSLEPRALLRRAFTGAKPIRTSATPADQFWIIDAFFQRICEASGLPRERILLLVDSERCFAHGVPDDVREDDTRRMIMETAAAYGIACRDLEPAFRQDYAANHLPLDWFPLDRHWNARAHRIVGESILTDVVTLLASHDGRSDTATAAPPTPVDIRR